MRGRRLRWFRAPKRPEGWGPNGLALLTRCFLALLLLAQAAPARAEWMQLLKTAEGDVHFVDADSVRVSGPRRVSVLTRIEFARPTYGMETRSMRMLVEHDCLLRKQRSLRVTYFTGPNLTGSADASRKPGAWVEVDLDTVGFELNRLLCQFL